MKKLFVLHPFLFAVYPILFLYYQNADQFLFSDAWILLGTIITLTLILVSLIGLILKDKHKVGFIVSFFLIIFFAYSRIFEAIPYWRIGTFVISRQRYLILVLSLLFVASALFTVKSRKNFSKVTSILNVVAATLVFFSLVQIIILQPKTGIKTQTVIEGQQLLQLKQGVEDTTEYPNIYYIILVSCQHNIIGYMA